MRCVLEPEDFGALLADRAFDVHWIVDALARKVTAWSFPNAGTASTGEALFKARHLIENFFGKLKEFKRIAMRSNKTDRSFVAMIHLSAAIINSR
ncbi:transposase [Gluconacetobacter entanii]|uniref:transposase n=1 Tax=Gluconacetobacter entanii TaxID=108528 RepID=UPI000DA157FA|nr:transposase [Gluconacetobacter entanii]